MSEIVTDAFRSSDGWATVGSQSIVKSRRRSTVATKPPTQQQQRNSNEWEQQKKTGTGSPHEISSRLASGSVEPRLRVERHLQVFGGRCMDPEFFFPILHFLFGLHDPRRRAGCKRLPPLVISEFAIWCYEIFPLREWVVLVPRGEDPFVIGWRGLGHGSVMCRVELSEPRWV